MYLAQWVQVVSSLPSAEKLARFHWGRNAMVDILGRGQGAEDLIRQLQAHPSNSPETFKRLTNGTSERLESLLGPRFLAHLAVQAEGGEQHSPAQTTEKNWGKIVVLGDVHRKWRSVQRILDHEFPEGGGIALAVGDLQTYPLLTGGHQVFFIPGNHENFSFVQGLPAASRADPFPGYFRIDPGDVIRIGGFRVAGLGGVLSPRFFGLSGVSVPPKYFTADQVGRVDEAIFPIDILLMHEAPYGVGFQKGGSDLGKAVLTGLIRSVRPTLTFFGHHHIDFDGTNGMTRIVGLNYPSRSYVVMEWDPNEDAITLKRVNAALVAEGHLSRWQYPWESGMESGASLLFGGLIPLKSQEKILRKLQERHSGAVEERLRVDLLPHVTGRTDQERDSQARSRAGLAVQTVLPHVAHYITRLESEGPPEEERRRLLAEIHDRMTEGMEPFVIPDLTKAFQYFLQSWGLVVN